jgi:hypothetical protein
MSKIRQVKVARYPGGVVRLQVLVKTDSGRFCTIWSDAVAPGEVEMTVRDIQSKLDMLVEAAPGFGTADIKPS